MESISVPVLILAFALLLIIALNDLALALAIPFYYLGKIPFSLILVFPFSFNGMVL
jgi:hypothetical protein